MMMTSHSATMKTLMTIESKESDIAAQKLAEANKRLKEAELSLRMLGDYRNDYMNQFNESLKTGLNSESYNNFQRFIKKLDQAISGQQDNVVNLKKAASEALAAWQLHERKKLSYGLIISHEQEKMHKQVLKKEQKMMDESASRSSRAKQNKIINR